MCNALIFAPDPEQVLPLQQQGYLPLAQSGYWAEQDTLRLESSFIRAVNHFKQNASPLNFCDQWLEKRKTDFIASIKTKIDKGELAEQLNAVFGMFERGKRLSVITGPPGAAKSTIASLWMQFAHAQYPAMPVILIAQEKTALDRLYDKINFRGACSWTIENAFNRDWPREAAIIIDEAGLLCTTTLSKLLCYAQKTDAVKIILIGDDKQLIADAPGQPFRWLCRQDDVDRVTMVDSFRQKNAALRQAVSAIYQNNITGAMKKIRSHFLQPDSMLPAIRTILDDATPDKLFIIVHGPQYINERLSVLCRGFRILSLQAAQGLAIDQVIFIIGEPINMAEMLVGCSRQRFELNVFIDAGIYPDVENFCEMISPYPESLMALDILNGEALLELNATLPALQNESCSIDN